MQPLKRVGLRGISFQDNMNPTIYIKELCFKEIKIAKGYQEHKAYKGAAFEESGLSVISFQDNLNPTIKIKELCFREIKIAKGYILFKPRRFLKPSWFRQ